MAQFRKKPVVVEAWRISFTSPDPKPDWLQEAFEEGAVRAQGGERPYCTIFTLEGIVRGNPGDWIIRGVEGELYPIRDGIFAATYEPA